MVGRLGQDGRLARDRGGRHDRLVAWYQEGRRCRRVETVHLVRSRILHYARAWMTCQYQRQRSCRFERPERIERRHLRDHACSRVWIRSGGSASSANAEQKTSATSRLQELGWFTRTDETHLVSGILQMVKVPLEAIGVAIGAARGRQGGSRVGSGGSGHFWP